MERSEGKYPYVKLEKGDEVVITGISGMFPDSKNVYHFRDNLFNKVDLVSGDFRRWRPIHPEVPQRTGKLFDIEKFDAGFFGVTSTQTYCMDPMIRLIQERTLEAMADAGYHHTDFEGSNTGVFLSACFSETERFVFYEVLLANGDAMIGTNRSMIAKRLNYYFKLKGPAYIVDTACSSSLFALEHAYQQIANGVCDKALVCATQLCLHPIISLQFKRLGVLCPDGSCKSFDANGNGYARSEGLVVLLLERAKDAKRIYSEVIYAKTNNDGFKKEGITFPSSEAQMALMNDFYSECGVDPTALTYMEAHGTGTKVGDPEEVITLDETFCKGRDRPLLIGTIKSNIGHNEPVSGISAIVKVVLAMETGFIPPNINFERPREGLKALEEGRMVVVTDKTPLPDQRGLIGVNSFGFGGGNAHVLLHWNPKTRDDGQYQDNLPRLICVCARVADGVNSILDDYKTRNRNPEYAFLIHQVFRKTTDGFFYRGYGLYSKQGEISRALNKLDLEQEKLYLVFSNFDKEWLKMGHRLMELPIFANSIRSIQNILLEASEVDISDIITNLSEENLINQVLGSVAIQISLANILKELKITPHRIVGVGSGELVAAYLDNYLTLKQTILGLFHLASNLTKTNSKNLESLEKILPQRKNSYEKWIPIHEEKLSQSCARYFAHNVVEETNGKHWKRMIPSGAFALVIGSKLSGITNETLQLLDVHSDDYVVDLMNNLGSLYTHGIDMDLHKLYPEVKLPVSRGTPMISPLFKWDHRANCQVFLYQNEAEVKSGHRVMNVTPKTEDWSFIVGHTVDGRNLFPATGYLVLVWESLAILSHKLLSEMKIVFEDVKFIRAANVPKDGTLSLMVMIQTGSGIFEIVDSGVTIVTGRVYERPSEESFVDLPITTNDDSLLTMDEKDVYKELKLRGYQYSGKFRGIKKCSDDASYSIIQWDDNWISFMDCILQIYLMRRDTRSTFVPTSIGYLMVDAPMHIGIVTKMKCMVPAYYFEEIGVLRTGGIELRGLGPSTITRRKAGDPVLEIYKFIANEATLPPPDSIRSLVQLVLENSNVVKVKVLEVCNEEDDEKQLVCPVIQKTLDDLPLIQQDITVLTRKALDLSRIAAQNKPLSVESQCLILVVKSVLEKVDVPTALNVVKDVKGFVISREDLDVDLSKFSNSPFSIFCVHKLASEILVLLRPKRNTYSNVQYVDLTNAQDHLEDWIPKLQDLLKERTDVILYSQNEELSGILGLVTCLKREPYGGKISCVFLIDDAPKFDPELPFYKEQLEKNMCINIWKAGSWGTYRHLSLPESQLVENEHCYANVTTRGDLSTLTWLEGKLNPEEPLPFDEKLVYVYYCALNFRDLMTASGKIPPDVVVSSRIEQECVQGFEFAGRTANGERVFGIVMNGALATLVPGKVLLPVPDGWTMEQAATTLAVYGTVIEILFKAAQPKSGQSILIHSATGGVGQAAVNLCHYFGLEIFVTVGTPEKRQYIRDNFPFIKEEHIGNSRDTTFEEMIHKYTDGGGVDFVLNSLAEEKLIASVRCIKRGGKFLEIGKFDLASNNPLALQLLERDVQFIGMALDSYIFKSGENYLLYMDSIRELLNCGAIKPLPTTVFQMDEVEKAFRYLGTGKHTGKIVLKIRDEEPQKISVPPKRLFKGLPRFYCNPKCSYIVYGGLGGFGLELADLLVIRGAKNLILTSKSGISNGYQRYRMRIWKTYGVNVIATTVDASTEEGCTELLNLATKLGPVDGIFNLAVVLKDALFENQTAEDFKIPLVPKADCTKNLDSISRKLCPNLRYFVIFSSISCGRGNVGQTNYGMANSIMERICEKRKKEGLPALAIQWGAIGEVGLVAKMQEDHRELVIGGTLQQRISSCLQVMDLFMKQDETIVASMLVAEKRYGGKASNLFEEVLNIMGVNPKTVSMHSSFPELGMDSMTAVEIKQTLEREYEVFLTPQDIRGMTLAKLKDLSEEQLSQSEAPIGDASSGQNDLPLDVMLLVRFMGNEEISKRPALRMKTLLGVEQVEKAKRVIILPGVEGTCGVLESLCGKLKADVTCLQYGVERKSSITQLVQSLLPHVNYSKGEELTVIGYSFGTVVATELISAIQANTDKVKLIFIDGAPELMMELTKTYFPTDDENVFQITLLNALMMRYMSFEEILKHQIPMANFASYREKIEYMISVSPKVDTSSQYIVECCESAYDRLSSMYKYKGVTEKLKSKVTLFKARSPTLLKTAADYGLSKICQEPVNVMMMEGNHLTILENDDLASEINKILLA